MGLKEIVAGALICASFLTDSYATSINVTNEYTKFNSSRVVINPIDFNPNSHNGCILYNSDFASLCTSDNKESFDDDKSVDIDKIVDDEELMDGDESVDDDYILRRAW